MMDVDEAVKALLAANRVEEAFDVLFQGFARDIERFVRSRIHHRQLAQDVCQEAWVAVREALVRFRGGSVRSWLFAIAFHKIADALRESVPAAELDSHLQAQAPHAHPPTTPSRKLARKQDHHRLLAWLEGLTPAQRELFELRYVDGCKPADIAARLSNRGEPVSADAVAQRLHRLVVELRHSLEEP